LLELRPNCEHCDKGLPANSKEARICSYECTFCSSCVENILLNVCPNCGGGFENRPIRPAKSYRENVGLEFQPASGKRVRGKHSAADIDDFSDRLAHLAPEQR